MRKTLEEKLNDIDLVFDINELLNLKINNDYISKYYKINKIPYDIFHNRYGYYHMGFSNNNNFIKKDLEKPLLLISSYINENTKNVLELATGKGSNTLFLAKNFSSVNFSGIDLSNLHTSIAIKRTRKLSNVNIAQGDFSNLPYENNTFDLIFVIESLCHAHNKEAVFKEVMRILKHSGVFIVIDGFRSNKNLNSTDKVALQITFKSMAVPTSSTLNELINISKSLGFKVINKTNKSAEVIPSMRRLEKLSSHFFNHKSTAKIITKILPKAFTYSAIAGYLMPTLIEENIAEYWVTVFQKN